MQDAVLEGMASRAARDWEITTAGDVAKLIRGVTYTKDQCANAAAEGFVPLLRATNINEGRLDYDNLVYVEGRVVTEQQLLRKDDIILTMSSGSIAHVGKSALIDKPEGKETFGAFCGCLRAESILPRFLFYYLQTHAVRRRLSTAAKGTNINNLKRDHVLSLQVPRPTLAAQGRIVDRLDELFTELDDGEEALRRARAELEIYRKSLLKAAVTGELTGAWRAANPPKEDSADLVARILADRRACWENDPKNKGRGYKEARVDSISPEHQRRMWALPDEWQWVQIGTFAFVTKLAGFEYTKFVVYSDDGDLPVLKAENAGKQGFRTTNYSHVHSASVAELARSRLKGGELLMVFVGAGTGNVATVPHGKEFFLGPNVGMIRIESAALDPEYLELFLRSPQGHSLALALAKAVAQPSLSMGTIRQIPIAVPPLAEQLEIVRRLRGEMGKANEGEAEVTRLRTDSYELRQSILAAAFRGELVQ